MEGCFVPAQQPSIGSGCAGLGVGRKGVQNLFAPIPLILGCGMTADASDSITISKAEHAALLKDRELLIAMRDVLETLVHGIAKRSHLAMRGVAPVAPNPGFGRVSPIDRDPELADFIRSLMGREKLTQIAALCVARFGPDRAPSKSAIHRFWQRCNEPSGPA